MMMLTGVSSSVVMRLLLAAKISASRVSSASCIWKVSARTMPGKGW